MATMTFQFGVAPSMFYQQVSQAQPRQRTADLNLAEWKAVRGRLLETIKSGIASQFASSAFGSDGGGCLGFAAAACRLGIPNTLAAFSQTADRFVGDRVTDTMCRQILASSEAKSPIQMLGVFGTLRHYPDVVLRVVDRIIATMEEHDAKPFEPIPAERALVPVPVTVEA